MNILHIDIDSLRADHLGCYGYGRGTSPVVDALAAEGTVFTNCYISDGPCLPSRTALWSGRAGIHTGVVNHGGEAAQPFRDPGRGFNDIFSESSWPSLLRASGYRTASVSSFAQRHSAWHCVAGFQDVLDPGRFGHETADQVNLRALEWLERHGQGRNWYLHVNYWDPHTPYRTPADFADGLEGDPLPRWMTEEVLERQRARYGPHSARDVNGFGDASFGYPRQPDSLDSLSAVRRWIQAYDVGIRYVDNHVGQLLHCLEGMGILDTTIVIISADHGEALGELNVWGDHHLPDQVTARVPLIIRVPGEKPGVDARLHYAYDWPATLLTRLGLSVPRCWDGQTHDGSDSTEGRPYIVSSHGAWTCSRAVRWDRYLCLRVYHPGYHEIPAVLLWDVEADPHEQVNLAPDRPDIVQAAESRLTEWRTEMIGAWGDPMLTVLREGGPWHTRGQLSSYLERLRATDRKRAAEALRIRAQGLDLAEWSGLPGLYA